MASQQVIAGKPSRRVALAFGMGALSSGVVTQALTLLALLFYNQVVGLSPAAVGLALMISLTCDAFIDPAIGIWSDNIRTPLGRRHPFMYAAILPAGVAFWLLWSPPAGLSHGWTFVYLLATLISIRLFSSLYEVPSTSLIPELAPDYDVRTGLISMRYFCGVVGGLLVTLMAFQVFLNTRAGGVTHRGGYEAFGLAGGILISLTLLISTAGTHEVIPTLPAPLAVPRLTLRETAWRIVQAVTNRNFAVIIVAALFSGVAAGLTQGLGTYFNLYFWGFSTDQLSVLAAPALVAGIVGVALAPACARRWGKKPLALTVFSVSLFTSIAPMALRLLGWLPGNNWPWLLPLIMVETMMAALLTLMGLIVVTSMLADVVEDNAARTGHRSEGLFFAANGILSKTVTGIGTFGAGLLLTIVHFPTKATPGHINPTLMHQLGLIYLPVSAGLTLTSLAILSLYRIDRVRHAANLARLGVQVADATPPATERTEIPTPSRAHQAEAI